MSNLVKIDAESISFENDLDKPLLGAVVKDPTVVGIAYFMGAIGLCFVPGFGVISAIALSALGAMDVVATLSADQEEEKTLTFDKSAKTTARLETEQRVIAPVRPGTAPQQPQAPAPIVAYDKDKYTQPSPWGAPVKGPDVQPLPANSPRNVPATPSGMPSPAEYRATNQLVTERLQALGVSEDELLNQAEAQLITPTVPQKASPDLARIMATPDADGYYRSRLLTARTRTGKGLVTLAALTILRTELGLDVELFCIDAKDDPNEAHRWSVIPSVNRYQFSGRAPNVDPADIKAEVDRITTAFYYSKSKYSFLVISELKILMSVLSRAGRNAQRDFSSFVSAQACGGASSHQYVWIDTNVVGLAENGFNGAGDRDAFELDWLVKEDKQKQITGHQSFVGDARIPSKVFSLSGRAFSSTSIEGWHPVPTTYNELDKTLRDAAPPVVSLPTIAENLPEATDKEAEDLAFVCNAALKSLGAISQPLESIAATHSGIQAMLTTPSLKPSLVAALYKANDLGLLRVIELGGSFTIGAIRNEKQQRRI
jgi:hypothetical protein